MAEILSFKTFPLACGIDVQSNDALLTSFEHDIRMPMNRAAVPKKMMMFLVFISILFFVY
jgi:hypothetical protein